MERMDKDVITHVDNVEMKSIAIMQTGHVSADVILVISEICAKQVRSRAVFQLGIYRTPNQVRNPSEEYKHFYSFRMICWWLLCALLYCL